MCRASPLAVILSFSLLGVACSETRDNGGGTPKPKDSGVPADTDGGGGAPDAGMTGNMDATTGNLDAMSGNLDAQGGNPDALGNPDAMGPADTGGAPFDGGTLTGDPFNAQTLAGQYASAFCAHRETCEPVYLTYLPQTRQQCETESSAAILSTWSAFTPLIQAGRMAFSQANFNRCMTAYQTALTDCGLGVDPLACDGIFIGNRPANAPCGASPECGNGLWCALQALGGCGTCTPMAQAGDDCSQNVCVSGTDCLELNDGSQVCIPNTAGLNGTCGTIQTGLCRGHLQCVGPQAGPFTCQRAAANGAACDPTGVAVSCDIFASSACNSATAAGTCVALNVANTGAACGMNQPTVLCNSANRCDTATNMCQALPTMGGACNANVPCGRGFFCTPPQQGTCTAERARGQACTGSVECAGQDYCINGMCAALSFNGTCN